MDTAVLPDQPNRKCPNCGKILPPDAPAGLCPACLMAGALGRAAGEAKIQFCGRRVGNYELVEELARGGMGAVWRARQLNLDREVAVKMILAAPFASDQGRQRFKAEAEAAARLNHPNVVPIYEVGELDGVPFYAMKLFPEGNLAAKLSTVAGKPRFAAEFTAKIARAVHHAHQRGILHRDLKPANILLDGGEPMVTDFGLAKRLDETRDFTIPGSVMGSPGYMSPEQAAGRTKDLSTASDIFSMGAILYHLLTGEPPFKADSPLETMKLVLEATPTNPRAKNRKVDRNLETICLKCLAREPTRRYGSAEALADDLERWLRGEPVTARRAPVWEAGYRWLRRRPAVAALIGLVVITAAIGVAAFHSQLEKTRAALHEAEVRALAERSARAPVLPPVQTMSFDYDAEIATLSPDGRSLLYTSGSNAWIQNFQTGQTNAMLQGHTSFIRLAQWSTDGQRIVTASTCQKQPLWGHALGQYGDQTIRVWDGSSGKQLALIQPGFTEPISTITISPDGDRIAAASVDGTAAIWKVGETNPLARFNASGVMVERTLFSPDGRRLLTTSSANFYWINRKHPGGGTYGSIGRNEHAIAKSWDGLTGKELFALDNLGGGRMPMWNYTNYVLMDVRSSHCTAAFSPDARLIATASESPANTAIWDAATGKPLHQLLGHLNAIHSAAFSRDGSRIVTASEDRTARVWDAATGRELAVLQPHPREVSSASFAPDSRWVLTVARDFKLRVWDTQSGVCVAVLRGHQGEIHSAEFSADGREIVSASADKTVRRWRWETFEQLAIPLVGHSGGIRSVQFSEDGNRVLTASEDRTARLWETRSGRNLMTTKPDLELVKAGSFGHANGSGFIEDAEFSPDGRLIATASSDPKLAVSRDLRGLIKSSWAHYQKQPFTPGRLWDASSGALRTNLMGARVGYSRVLFSPDGRRILFRELPTLAQIRTGIGNWSYSGSGGSPVFGQASLWDAAGGTFMGTLSASGKQLVAASFSPNGDRILVADDKVVQLFDRDGKELQSLPEAVGSDWTAFSPDGTQVLAQDKQGYPALWDAQTGEIKIHFKSAGMKPHAVWFGQAAGDLIVVTGNGRLCSLNLASGELLWEVRDAATSFKRAVISRDGHWLAAVTGGHAVDLWDLTTHKQVRSIERHVHDISAIQLSADGQWLATSDQSGEIWLWPLRLADQ